jgi:hypothetical protein
MDLHRWFKAFISLVIVVAVMGIMVSVHPVTAQPSNASFSATLEPIAGLVQFLPAGQTSWQTLTKVTLVHEGDQIRTGDLGAARLSTVTGIKVEIYPTTLLQVRILALGDGTNSSLSFRLSQVVGVTYMTIDQPLKASDNVQIVTPAALATIHGTRLYTFASRSGDTGFFGDQNKFVASSPVGQTYTNDQDNITFFPLSAPVAQCTLDFLKANGQGSLLTELKTAGGRKLLGSVLTSFLPSNVHTRVTDFLSRLLGFTDAKTVQQILDALNSMDKPMEMSAFMTDFRSFLRAYFAYLSSGVLSPTTCGNGKVDSGETAQNCAVDVANVAPTTGNKLCETEKGESLVNDTPDCLPFGGFVTACEDLIDRTLGKPPVGAPGAGGQPVPPKPSGIG